MDGIQTHSHSGNEICLVICARSGRRPWAFTNPSTELRSGEGLEAEGLGGAETGWSGSDTCCSVHVCVHAYTCGCVCVHTRVHLGGMYLCDFVSEGVYCPHLWGCPCVSALLPAHMCCHFFLVCVCLCACVHNHTLLVVLLARTPVTVQPPLKPTSLKMA